MALIPLKDADEVERAMCLSLRRPRNPERYQRVIEASSARHQAFMQSRQAKDEAKKMAEDRPTLIIDVTARYGLVHEALPWVHSIEEIKVESDDQLVSVPERPIIKIHDIQAEVCRAFEISRNEFVSSRRQRKLSRARQISMYLCKVMTSASYPLIAKHLGNRDHTTILHGVRKIERQMVVDQVLEQEVSFIRRRIELRVWGNSEKTNWHAP